MNAAKLDNSERLQRVASLLKDRKPHSTMDIIRRARVCAVNSIIAELRFNGKHITCNRKQVNDKAVWFYRLA